MERAIRAILGVALISGWAALSGGVMGCGVEVADPNLDSGVTYTETTYTSYSTGDYIPTNDKLIVDGQGEAINLEYNNLAFPALINYDDGEYYFAPDDGSITGDQIVCAAVINQDEVQGDCFRLGLVCHFDYWSDYTPTADGKDVYSLNTTSCRRGGLIGPFLVPLDSPKCGQDPFPPCPTPDYFPNGAPPPPPPPESQPTH